MNRFVSIPINLAGTTGATITVDVIDAYGVIYEEDAGTVVELENGSEESGGAYVWYGFVPQYFVGHILLTVNGNPVHTPCDLPLYDQRLDQVLIASAEARDYVRRCLDLLLADESIDKTTDAAAWSLVKTLQGSGNLASGVELKRQALKDVDGVALGATTSVVGRAIGTQGQDWHPFEQIADVRLALVPHLFAQQYQECYTDQRLTRADGYGDPVGVVVDASDDTHVVYAPNDPARPTLRGGGSPKCFFEFDGASDYLIVENSRQAFAALVNDGDATIAIRFRCRPGSNGQLFTLLDSTNLSGAGVGFFLRRQANNTLRYTVTNGTATAFTKDTTATVTDADGWVTVLIKEDGSSGTIQVGENAAENITYPASLSTNPATYNLHIGRRNNAATDFAPMDLAWLVIAEGQTTVAEDEQLRNYDPQPTSISRGGKTAAAPGFKDFTHKHSIWLADETASLYQEVARTTPATADTNPVGSWSDYRGTYLNRILSTATSGDRPTLQTNEYNATKNTVRWDGVDDNLDLAQAFYNHGDFTLLLVAKNSDPTYGSHFAKGNEYIVKTGNDYNPGGGGDHERWVWHQPGLGDASFGQGAGAPGEAMPGETLFAAAFRRQLDQMTIFCQGIKGFTTVTKTDAFQIASIGDYFSTLTDFQLDGDICGYGLYLTAFGDAAIDAWMNKIADDYGITLLG